MLGRFTFPTAVLGLIGAFGGAAAQAEQPRLDHGKIAEAALTKHLQPRYGALVTAFAGLESATKDVCAAGEPLDASKLRAPFRTAVIAWGEIAHFTRGPIGRENRYDRIYFWLDRKGIARRQVRRALRREPDSYRNPKSLGSKSIGVQGLSAYELLLVSAGKENPESDFRCAFAAAVAGNLKLIAADVSAAWSDGGEQAKWWRSPGPGNPVYLKANEPTFALVRTFLEAIERVRDVELGRPVGVGGRQLSGPFARSDLTMTFLDARVRGLHAMMVESGLVEQALTVARARKSPGAEQQLNQLEFEMSFLERRLGALSGVPNFFQSERFSEVFALGFPLKSARLSAEAAIAELTDLPFGFNAADGD